MLSSSLASMRHSGRQLSNTSQAPPAVFQRPSSQLVARSGTNPRNVTVNTSVTHRKRSKAEDSGCSDCNDCESLTPKAGAEVVCIKISLQGQLRRFRVPTPLSIDTIRTICQHCYGLNGDVALAYQRQTDSRIVSFDTTQELLAELVADNKISKSGELELSSCLRIVVDKGRKKSRLSRNHPANSTTASGPAAPSTLIAPPKTQDDIPLDQREISVDSVGSFGMTNILREQILNGGDVGDDFDVFGGDGDQTLDFMFDDLSYFNQPGLKTDLEAVDFVRSPGGGYGGLEDSFDNAVPLTQQNLQQHATNAGDAGSGFDALTPIHSPRQISVESNSSAAAALSNFLRSQAEAEAANNAGINVAVLKSQTVRNVADVPCTLGSLMTGKATLIHLVRRYGCSLCRDHARELSLLKPTLANYGVSMIAIGRGSDGIQKWVKGGSWQGDTYYEAEPDCPVSKALMLSNTANVWGLFAPKALKTVLSSSQSDIAKDAASEPWKLSGTFVFSQDGTLVYGMRQKQITDSPNLEELMNACRVASGHGEMDPDAKTQYAQLIPAEQAAAAISAGNAHLHKSKAASS